MQELKVQSSAYRIELMVQEDKVRNTFSRKLALACEKAGLESHGQQIRIAKAMGVTPKAVSKWFNAEAIPRRGKMAELATYLGTSASFLMGETDKDGIVKDSFRDSGDHFRVDVFDIQASAGSGVMIRDEFVETIKSIEYSTDEAQQIFHGRPAEHIKMIAVNGDSMSGTFEPRDQIFVDVSVDFFDGDGIYIFTIDDKLYIKRLQLQFDRLAIISDNKKYETWHMGKAQISMIHIIAKVLVSQSRAYKFHS